MKPILHLRTSLAQLRPDEGLILFHLKKKSYTYRQHAEFDHQKKTFCPRTLIENEFPVSDLVFPQNFEMYMDHLHHLDLAGVWQNGNQEPTYAVQPGVQTGVNINSVIRLQSFGNLFARACVPDVLPTNSMAN